jgi:hypothetical protein
MQKKSGDMYNFHAFGASEEGYWRDFLVFTVFRIKRHIYFGK